MSRTVGCFNFLRGRRSTNKNGVAAPLEVQQPPRHHGGGEVVSGLAHTAGYFNPVL